MATADIIEDLIGRIETVLGNIKDSGVAVFKSIVTGRNTDATSHPAIYILPARDFRIVPAANADYHRWRFILSIETLEDEARENLLKACTLAGRVEDAFKADRTQNGLCGNTEITLWDFEATAVRRFMRDVVNVQLDFFVYQSNV